MTNLLVPFSKKNFSPLAHTEQRPKSKVVTLKANVHTSSFGRYIQDLRKSSSFRIYHFQGPKVLSSKSRKFEGGPRFKMSQV